MQFLLARSSLLDVAQEPRQIFRLAGLFVCQDLLVGTCGDGIGIGGSDTFGPKSGFHPVLRSSVPGDFNEFRCR